ncbi:RNA polymerase sigma factor [Corynebacterium sp. NPDC060344]|uniref:RNA polymerase sigma factor n=1 Tax=Corynebacterium sp. NPDC060344 TaxID=3347101 RepID=UPI00365715BB
MTDRQREDERVTALALKAGRGDRAALTEFIRATQNDVWRLLAHLANADVADDLTQETYLRVMSALPRFAGRSSARTWLLSLARRAWVDSVRHDMARPRKSAVEWEEATQASSTGTSWAELVDARVLMEALDEDRREALILTQVLGYTYQEAADIAGVRVGTIRSRVARARQDLVAASEGREESGGTAGGDAGTRGDADGEPGGRHLTAM